MFKQRDNEFHPPMTTDPTGSGIVSSAVTAAAAAAAGGDPFAAGPAVAAGSRKRGRDIRGLDRFRSVVYGEGGFRRLHAMVARNPTLMYPPAGIAEARARVAAAAAQAEAEGGGAAAGVEGEKKRRAGEDEEDIFALFEERKAAEEAAELLGQLTSTATQEATQPTVSASADVAPPLASLRHDAELARYHHRQLDTFLHVLYEFNHVSFVKLPMEDTLQLLSRCGKEAVAHVMEYETQLRLRRQARIKELQDIQEERTRLQQRRLAFEEAEQARLLAEAEQRQEELDRLADGEALPGEQVDGDGETALDTQVKVKEEGEDVKDIDLVTTAAPTETELLLLQPLPVVESAEVAPEYDEAA